MQESVGLKRPNMVGPTATEGGHRAADWIDGSKVGIGRGVGGKVEWNVRPPVWIDSGYGYGAVSGQMAAAGITQVYRHVYRLNVDGAVDSRYHNQVRCRAAVT